MAVKRVKVSSGPTSMAASQSRRKWSQIYGRKVPDLPSDLLGLSIAYWDQGERSGGLPRHLDEQIKREAAALNKSGLTPKPPAVDLQPGTQLLREFQGRTYRVLVLRSGYEMNGEVFESLTAAARKITGTHYPGPRFFGLRRRKGASQ